MKFTEAATMKRTRTAVMALLAAAAFSAHAAATSLWTDTSPSLFTDKKALYVGDIVTIVVSESTQATQQANSGVKQDTKVEASDGTGILNKFFNALSIEAGTEYGAEGKTTAGSNLRTTISAEVMEVLPNGNLLVEARRAMVVNEETQTMVLSGIIRPQDVGRDNMVMSSVIAALNLRYEGKGPTGKIQKPGILHKLFNVIF